MNEIDVTFGSDMPFEIIWPAEPGDDAEPEDIRGHALEVIDCAEPLQTHMTLNIADGENGQILGLITWHSSMTRGRSMSFILRKFNGTIWQAMPRITVNVI
jgi:hypothetical protein